MPKEVIMPALGMAQDVGVLLRWLKKEGEMVTAGEPLMEVATDKVDVQVEAPASGLLAAVTAREGDEVPVGQVIGLIAAEGEEVPSAPATAEPEETPAVETGPSSSAPLQSRRRTHRRRTRRRSGRRPGNGRPHLQGRRGSPHSLHRLRHASARFTQGAAARARTRRRSGRTGWNRSRRRRACCRRPPDSTASFLPRRQLHEPAPAATEPAAQPVSRMWQIMAERLTGSWTSVPHFYLVREVNADQLIHWRTILSSGAADGPAITYTDLLTKLAALSLARFPRLNSFWDEGNIVTNPEINVGLAVAVEDGLLVPVVHSADRLRVDEIAARRADLVARAGSGGLQPDDFAGGTFTISNLGMFGVDAFNAIVNPPQAAILAVGRIADRVVAVDGQPAVRPMMTLTLSCDHRAVDGVRAAQFFEALVGMIEEPLRAL